MREMVEESIRDYGQPLEIRGQDGTIQKDGFKNTQDRIVFFRAEVQVRAGDCIVDEGEAEYYVTEVDRIRYEGQVIGVKAHYKSKAQHEADLAASRPSTTNTLNIGEASSSNFNMGVQGNIDMRASYDFRSIEQQIDRMADPAEAEEFRAALNEIRVQMEQDGAIKGGSLARFNENMQNSGWFTGPLSGLVMRFIFGG